MTKHTMTKLKQITPGERMMQELLRIRREIDLVLNDYYAAVAETEEQKGSPTLRVVDPLEKHSNQ